LRELIDLCKASSISVLGYHVPHCPTLQIAKQEVEFLKSTVQDFDLAGVVIDNEDGSAYFKGTAQTAQAYASALKAAMKAASKIVVMSSNDIISYHKKAYSTVIGAFVDINVPQVYYGQSRKVADRLSWPVGETKSLGLPFSLLAPPSFGTPTTTTAVFSTL
jgi:hypothetical protein